MTALYLFLMPLGLIPVAGGVSLLKIITYPIIFVCLFDLITKDEKYNLNLTHILFAAFIIYTAASVIFYNTAESRKSAYGFLQIMFVCFVFSCRMFNKHEYKIIELSFILMGIFVLVLFFLCGETLLEKRNTFKIMGTSADPNEFCGYLILPEVFCIKCILSKNKYIKVRLCFFVYLMLILYAVLKSGSRGGLAAIVFTAVMCGLIFADGAKNKVIFTLATVLTFIVAAKLFLLLLPSEIADRMAIKRIVYDRGTGRLDIWKTLIDATVKNNKRFIFGGGTTSAIDTLTNADIGNTVAHNQFIQVFHDGGIFGIILFVSAYFSAFMQNFKHNKCASAAIVGFAVLGMSLTFDPSMKIFWNAFMFCLMRFEDGEGDIRYKNVI